ncbi:Ig-like domain-containing protein [Clostridium oryzae]|uniref:Kappa-carrageenase n=1 Tax=Clostridium oryzae TaxID=1450648 RepID=A0A1V4IWU6_9CLOT|nr:Ig-like domain-containing protein [Clostridium oryzae]OPJ64379.1 kappa-carrageenase precursor [Clostridium oryzae]
MFITKGRFTKGLVVLLSVLMDFTMMPGGVIKVKAATSLNISSNNIEISSAGDYVISGGSNSNTIKVDANIGTVNIMLNRVNIKFPSGTEGTPIDIEDGNTVNLTLNGVNTIIGGNQGKDGYPAESAMDIKGSSTCDITSASTGTLNATGSTGCPAICVESLATLHIEGGTIIAQGGDYGASAIGAEQLVDTGTIFISGGTVTATAGNAGQYGNAGGAGIGSGQYAEFKKIQISGGQVNATGINGAGIGSGDTGTGGEINITGGTVTSNGIGNGSSQKNDDKVYIQGGSVNAGSISPTPQYSGTIGSNVYLTKIQIPNTTSVAKVDSLALYQPKPCSYPYGSNDLYTDTNGYLYLYICQSSENTSVSVTASGNEYNYSGLAGSGSNTLLQDQRTLSVTGMQSSYIGHSQTMTPDTSGGSGNGDVTFSYSGRSGTDYGPTAQKPIDVGNYTVTATKSSDGTYNGTSASYDFAITENTSIFSIDSIANQTYSGSAISPGITVRDSTNNSLLTEGQDYTISYPQRDNIDAGTAHVKIAGTKSYAGCSGSTTFNIKSKECTFSVGSISDKTYTGSEIKPNVTVKDPDTNVPLKEGADYTVSYSSCKNVGTVIVTVTGINNYDQSSGSATFKIVPKSLTDSSINVEDIPVQTYDGSTHTPDVNIKDGDTTLIEGTDYTVTDKASGKDASYTTASSYMVVVTGIGNYSGTIERAFTIVSTDATLNSVSVSSGTLSPAFSADKTQYMLSVGYRTDSITVTPKANESHALITVNGNVVRNNTVSSSIALTAGEDTTITIVVTAQAGNTKNYMITVHRAKVPVTGIMVSGTGGVTSVTIGNTLQMGATVTPLDATDSSVTWSVTNGTGSATISDNGLLSATGAGTVTVKATAKDGSGVIGAETITVTAATPATVSVTGVSLDSTSKSLTIGDCAILIATVTPSDATDKNVSWSSSNIGIATVDSIGKVTAVGVGTATITATTPNGNKTANCVVTVSAASTGGDSYSGGSGGSTTTPIDITIIGTTTTIGGNAESTATITPSQTNTSMINHDIVKIGNVTVTAPASVLNNALGDGTGLTLSQSAAPKSTQTAAQAAVSKVNGTVVAAVKINLNRTTSTGTEAVHILSGEVTVTITLTDAQIAAIKVGSNPHIYYYDSDTGTLIDMNATFDLTKRTATFQTTHFSNYIFATESKVPPVVSGVNNKGIYNANKVITFNEGTATLDGTAFTSGAIVSTEGKHTLVVIDAAGNTTTVVFTIDKTAPKITINRVKSSMVVTVTEANLMSKTVTLNGKKIAWPRKNKFTKKGAYIVTVTDKVGHKVARSFKIGRKTKNRNFKCQPRDK